MPGTQAQKGISHRRLTSAGSWRSKAKQQRKKAIKYEVLPNLEPGLVKLKRNKHLDLNYHAEFLLKDFGLALSPAVGPVRQYCPSPLCPFVFSLVQLSWLFISTMSSTANRGLSHRGVLHEYV